MTHVTIRDINEYFDGMLDEIANRNVEAHLRMCNQCRTQFEELETVFSMLTELPELPLDRDLTPSILAHLQNSRPPTKPWRKPIFVIQTFLAIILLLFSSPILYAIDLQALNLNQNVIFPSITYPPLIQLFAQLITIQNWMPQFTFTMPEVSFPPQLVPFNLVANFKLDIRFVMPLIILSGLLWVIGNLFLLRKTQEVRE